MEGQLMRVLTREQADLLTAVLNRIIPAGGEMPAAGDLGISTYVDGILFQAPHLRPHILGLLGRIQMEGEFESLPDDGRDALLRRIEAERRESFNVLLRVVYNGYYSSGQVLEAIGWSPPDESGYQLEPFDPGLLDNVRKRGPIYTDI